MSSKSFDLLLEAGLVGLPNEWDIVTIGQILSKDRGISVGVMYPGDHVPSGIPLIRAGDLNGNRINSNPNFRISSEKHFEYRRTALEGGELLLSLVGNLGQCAVVPDSMVGWNAARAIAVIRLADKSDTDFVRLCLISEPLQYLMNVWATTTVQATLNLKEIKELPIPWPPKQERRTWVATLSALDDKIELNRRMNQTLESMAQAVFRQWFVESKEVESWKIGKLSEICTTQYGFTASASDKPVGPKFLRITDMNKEPWIVWADIPYCEINEKELEKYKLGFGDILVSRIADPGKAGIVEEEVNAVFASYLVRLKFKELAWAYFAYYFLRSELYLEYANGAKSGSVQSGMNARVITDVDLSIPPDENVAAFYGAIKPLRNKIVANLKESRTLASLRDSLLPKLMSGGVRVKDVEKEL